MTTKYENACWTGILIGLAMMLIGFAFLVATGNIIVMGIGVAIVFSSLLAGIPGIIFLIWKDEM